MHLAGASVPYGHISSSDIKSPLTVKTKLAYSNRADVKQSLYTFVTCNEIKKLNLGYCHDKPQEMTPQIIYITLVERN